MIEKLTDSDSTDAAIHYQMSNVTEQTPKKGEAVESVEPANERWSSWRPADSSTPEALFWSDGTLTVISCAMNS